MLKKTESLISNFVFGESRIQVLSEERLSRLKCDLVSLIPPSQMPKEYIS
jgi:hypothetical protein